MFIDRKQGYDGNRGASLCGKTGDGFAYYAQRSGGADFRAGRSGAIKITNTAKEDGR